MHSTDRKQLLFTKLFGIPPHKFIFRIDSLEAFLGLMKISRFCSFSRFDDELDDSLTTPSLSESINGSCDDPESDLMLVPSMSDELLTILK